MTEHDKHWLVRARTIRLLWLMVGTVLVLTVIAGLFVHQHEHFGIEASFAFYAWYGFGACVAMVVLAKLLGIFLKRPDDYYQRPEDVDD